MTRLDEIPVWDWADAVEDAASRLAGLVSRDRVDVARGRRLAAIHDELSRMVGEIDIEIGLEQRAAENLDENPDLDA